MYNTKLHFHFTGIGGSGMSGIAEILLNLGFKVSGTDLKDSSMVQYLRSKGATVFIGHSAQAVPPEASLLVYSSAVKMNNPELVEARARSIPVIRRAEVLAELMRLKFSVGVAGSHGKTTTTTMTAGILERGDLDPTVIIGGQVISSDSGARVGKSEYLVAETDESDRSFLLLKPTIAVVTNIDAEHLNAYESFSELIASFQQFVEAVPFYGLAVLCIDCPRVRDIYSKYQKRKISYGFSPDALVQPGNIREYVGGIEYDIVAHGTVITRINLPTPGRHLMLNSLAAACVGLEFGIAPDAIKDALDNFPGVHRRLELSGTEAGILVINDYGHHPTEIKATLEAVRSGWAVNGKIHVIFQPHRYSRTKDCFVDFLSSFEAADSVIISEIYAASEDPIDGITGESLCAALHHKHKRFIGDLESAAFESARIATKGDVIVCLGAGSIGALPPKVLDLLSKRPALVA